jgi:hypothetical protein
MTHLRRLVAVAPLYVQVSKSDNVRHVNISGASAVICIEQLRLSLLAKSLWIRGLNAFLGNLSQRFTIADEKGYVDLSWSTAELEDSPRVRL